MTWYKPGRNSVSCSTFRDKLNNSIKGFLSYLMDDKNLKDKAAFKDLESGGTKQKWHR